ncbi:hypothetical protein [Pseudoalteromonas luteoviolacea]|nr:hypothetical protein [Pseudoalteromonas luteoviolacea]
MKTTIMMKFLISIGLVNIPIVGLAANLTRGPYLQMTGAYPTDST